jgi:hypothetical protein
MFDKIDSLERHREVQSGEADEIRNAISDLRERTNRKVKHQLYIHAASQILLLNDVFLLKLDGGA